MDHVRCFVSFTSICIHGICKERQGVSVDNSLVTICLFFKHEKFEKIPSEEINDIRNKILNIANGNKNLTKREDYIWIFEEKYNI